MYDIRFIKISVCPLGKRGSDCNTACDSDCGNRGCSVSGNGCLGICPAGWMDSDNKCQTGKISACHAFEN